MPLVLRPPGETLDLPGRLASLGRAARAADAAAGVFQWLAVAAALTALAVALDGLLAVSPAGRAVTLATLLVTLGAHWRVRVRAAARRPADPLAVALELERRHPRFNDALASAVAFLEDEGRANRLGSTRFRGVAVVRATNLADQTDIDALVPTGALGRAFVLTVLAVFVAGGAFLTEPGRNLALFRRLVDPYGRHPWPTRTQLAVLAPATFPALHPLGEPFAARFRLTGIPADAARLQVRPAGAAGPVSEELLPLGDAPEFTATLDPGRAARDFEFRLRANDADTGWLPVRVAPPPALVPRDGRPSPQLRLTFPDYADLPPADLPDGAGVVEAVTGTRLHLRARADRPLVRATLAPHFDVAPLRAAQLAAALLPGPTPLVPLLASELAGEVGAPVPATLSGPDGADLELHATPLWPGLYALTLRDAEGLEGRRLLDLRIAPDPAPAVTVSRPDAARDPLTLLPTAAFPLDVRAADRVFAPRRLWLQYRHAGQTTWRDQPLWDGPAFETAVGAVTGPGVGRRAARPTEAGRSTLVPVASLLRPDGTPPRGGDVVTLRAAADDWDDMNPLKRPGVSPEWEVRVVDAPALEAMVQGELGKLRGPLRESREEQRRAREAAAAGDPAALAEAERLQREVARDLLDPAGPRARAAKLRDTLKANGVPPGPVADRAEAVAADLDRFAESAQPAAEAAVAAARQAPSEQRAAASAEARRKLEAGEAALDAALQKLEPWAGAGELRGDAGALREQLRKADAAASEAGAQVPAGRAQAELAPADRRALDRAAAPLDELAKQADEALAKAGRLAESKGRDAADLDARAAARDADAAGAPDPVSAELARAGAAELRRAADAARREADALRAGPDRAGGDALADDLRRAAEATRQNRPGPAADARRAAGERLERFADALAEKPAGSDELSKKGRDAARKAVDALAEAQDQLRKKSRDAAKAPDGPDAAEGREKLAGEQDQLARQADDAARALAGDPKAAPAVEELRRAAGAMRDAAEELRRNQPGDAAQEGLDRLEDALDRLADADPPKPDGNELQRPADESADLLKRWQALAARHAEAVAEERRLQEASAKAGEWSRARQRSYRDLADAEKGVGADARALAKGELAGAAVLSRLAELAAESLDAASAAAGDRAADIVPLEPLDAEAEGLASRRVRRAMARAAKRLDLVAEALKPPEKPKPGEKPEQPPMPMDGAAPMPMAGGKPAGPPPVAQLKALRSLQAEVAERTAALDAARAAGPALSDDDREELRQVEELQRAVVELFEQLAPQLQGGAP